MIEYEFMFVLEILECVLNYMLKSPGKLSTMVLSIYSLIKDLVYDDRKLTYR